MTTDPKSADVMSPQGDVPMVASMEGLLAELDRIGADADARSDEIEELRRLPTDLVEGLIDTGVFRLWVPARYGGAQCDVQTLLDVIEAVSYHQGSLGWCVMIGATTGLNGGHLPSVHAEEIYGDPRAVTGGLGRPSGIATSVGDDLRVSGTWAWGSGTTHCTWIGGGVRVVDADGVPTRLADGTAAPFVYFKRDEVELADNWHAMGLRGTASGDYRVDEVTVPAGRWVTIGGDEPEVDAPLYRFSFLGALALGVASVSLGLARRAIDELVALGTKKPDGSSKMLAERAPVQAELAQVDADVRSARAFVSETVASTWAAAETDEIGDEHKRLLRLAANQAVRRSVEVIDRCHLLGGGSTVHVSSPLQRVFRDAHVATQHAMTAPRMWEPLGRMAFGLETSTRQF